MENRSHYLDNVCCILIFHVVYTMHIGGACGTKPELLNYLATTFSFFMSWFFFKGGIVHKDVPTKEIIKKSKKRLLYPYLIFLLLGFVLDFIVKYCKTPEFTFLPFFQEETITFITNSTLWPTASAWFILTLFIVRIVFNVLNHKVHPLVISVLFPCIAYGVYLLNSKTLGYDFNLTVFDSKISLPPFYLGNMCNGLALYSMGYYLKEKQFDKRIFAICLGLFVLKFFWYSGIDFRANQPYGAHFLMAIVYGVSGSVVINNLFKMFLDKKITFVSHVGSNSMLYYLLHLPVMFVATSLFWNSFADQNYWIQFIILSFIVTISLILFEYILFKFKKLRFIIGQ